MNIGEFTISEPDLMQKRVKDIFNESIERAPGRAVDTILSVVGGDYEFSRRIDELLEGKKGAEGCPVNTYPFGEPTEKIYPQMLAVYKGEKKAAGWNELLEKALSYAEAERTCGIEEREIIILTDSWNPDMLKRLEDMLLDVYFKGFLAIYVFLYTYCGFTNIPLITNQRWQGEIPHKVDIGRVVRELARKPIYFDIVPSTWEQNKLPKEYEIHILNRNEAVIHERCFDRILYAGKKQIDPFAAVIGTLPREPGDYRRRVVLDGESCRISLPNIPDHIIGTYDDRTWEQMVSAFFDLIEGAKEKKDA